MKTYTKTETTIKPLLEIEYDEDPLSPREDSNLGYFITVDSRMHSPNSHKELQSIIEGTGKNADNLAHHIELMTKAIGEHLDIGKVITIYPICKYEHGGIVYSLGTQHGFDHSNNGFYIVMEETYRECFGKGKVNTKQLEKSIEVELDEYNKYVNGEMYRFTLYNKEGEVEDSCGSFYNIENIRDYLSEEWDDEDLNDYLID